MSGILGKAILICLLHAGLFAVSAQAGAKAINSVSPEELAQGTLVDVRTSEEYNSGHLNNAINIDWRRRDFRERVAGLPRDKPVYVYCQKGGRSAGAAVVLDSLGYKVIDLLGGYEVYHTDK